MNEEIKKILEDIQKFVNGDTWAKYFVASDKKIIPETYAMSFNTTKKILDYITNLQEENQKLKKQLNCKEYFSSTMPENTEFVILTKNNYDRQQKDLALENIELKQENEKLNKIIDELEKWLKETKKFNCGFKIKSEYIYTYEFVCKNILNKLTELKKEVE